MVFEDGAMTIALRREGGEAEAVSNWLRRVDVSRLAKFETLQRSAIGEIVQRCAGRREYRLSCWS